MGNVEGSVIILAMFILMGVCWFITFAHETFIEFLREAKASIDDTRKINKRFVRTKYGKIIDTKKLPIKQLCNNKARYFISDNGYLFEEKALDKRIKRVKIIKQADTIEELVKVGDMVVGYKIIRVDKIEIGFIRLCSNISNLYTKQGKDYVLVAEKKNGKWRVI